MKHISYLILIIFSIISLAICFIVDTKPRWNWISSIEATTKSSGYFVIKDGVNQEIILEWDKMKVLSSADREMMKKLSIIIVSAYRDIELKFLKEHSEIVKQIDFFKPFAYYFEGGIKSVNWGLVESKMEVALQNLALQDQSPFFDPSDLAIFVVIKKIDGTPLGFVQFIIRSEYSFGTVRLESMAILPEQRHRGFGKFLIGSIFKIIPNVDHIFLYTRPTNKIAADAYLSYGFYRSVDISNDPFVRQGYMKMEYLINRSNVLQRASREIN